MTVLGFRSKTAHLCALIRADPLASTARLVVDTGVSKHTVRAYRSILRKNQSIPHQKPAGRPAMAAGERARDRWQQWGQTVHIERETVAKLRPDARRRGLTAAELIRQLLTVIAEEKLVDAIIDDGAKTLEERS